MSSKSRFFDESDLRREAMLVPTVAAATATQAHPIFVAPCACKIRTVDITPQAAVTGDDTNTKYLNILNAGSAGSGTTEIGNLDLVTGEDLTAFDKTNIPLNSTYNTAGAAYADIGVTLAEGDVLTLQFEKVGNGVLVPNLIVDVWYECL